MSDIGTYPKTVTPAEAEAFFRQPANFVEKNVEAIFQILGYPDEWDDWDRGRIVCGWRNATHIVRAYTGDDRVNYVEVLKPRLMFWLGRSKEEIWRKEE